jgi:hypothetical protein
VGLTEILSQIDREIALLQQARALLAGSAAQTKKTAVSAAKPAKKKRRLSPEGRRRIALTLSLPETNARPSHFYPPGLPVPAAFQSA